MSDDRDLELGAALRALPTPEHDSAFWDELEERLAGEPALTRLSDHQRKRRPFPGAWLLSAAAAVALVVGTVAVLVRDDDEKGTDVSVTETTRPQPQASSWTDVPDGPLSARSRPVIVWTGSEVIVWSGTDGNGGFFDDGAVYDPAQRRWTSMSRPPTSLLYPKGVWAGDRMLVMGMAGFDVGQITQRKAMGLSYDPSTDSWTALSETPLMTEGDQAVVWAGDRMIVWGGGIGELPVADGASYDPRTDRWEMLPASPLSARLSPLGAWTGDRMILWGGTGGEEGSGPAPVDGATYDPASRTWSMIAGGAPLTEPILGSVWTGTALVVIGERSSAKYDPVGDTWVALEGFPLAPRFSPIVNSAGRDIVVVWGGQQPDGTTVGDGAVLDLRTAAWTALPAGSGSERADAASTWTGSSVFVWGGVRGRSYSDWQRLDDGFEFHPGTGGAAIPVTTTPSTPRPATSAPPADCGSIGFTPNSEDAASAIVAENMTCEEARALVQTVGAALGAVSGPDMFESGNFVCLRTARDESVLPTSTFQCTSSGGRRVSFIRT